MTKIDAEVYEFAALDGAHGLKLHAKITLTLISPSLFFVGVLNFVNSLKIFKKSYLYYNSNYPPDAAYMIQNYMNHHFFKLNYQNLSTAVVIFTATMVLVIFAVFILVMLLPFQATLLPSYIQLRDFNRYVAIEAEGYSNAQTVIWTSEALEDGQKAVDK